MFLTEPNTLAKRARDSRNDREWKLPVNALRRLKDTHWLVFEWKVVRLSTVLFLLKFFFLIIYMCIYIKTNSSIKLKMSAFRRGKPIQGSIVYMEQNEIVC